MAVRVKEWVGMERWGRLLGWYSIRSQKGGF